MGLTTIAKYLIGNRQAILHVADTPQSLWLGFLFVLSAGLAREYDGEDLLREPWHLLLPLGASLATATLLFGLLWIVMAGWKCFDSTPRAARAFLSLYWMTAPLAWLYAIPVEHFLSAVDATRFNLLFLGIVSVWRVVLMVRVVSVLYGVTSFHACWPVMLFADSLALVLITQADIPLLAVMGGIQLSESERLISSTTLTLGILCFYSWPVWFLITLPCWRYSIGCPPQSPLAPDAANRVDQSAWGAAAGAIAFGLALLPLTQPAQQLRSSVEYDLQHGAIRRGLMTMSAQKRDDFPPHWDPPPRISFGDREPPLEAVLVVLPQITASGWVIDIYKEKFVNQMGVHRRAWQSWRDVDNASFDGVLSFVEEHLVGEPHANGLDLWLESELTPESKRTPEQQARLRRLLKLAAESVY